MENDVEAELVDMCVEIFAHSYNGYEITLAGNGTNASEAANVARKVLNILGIKKDSLDDRIEKRAEELEKEYYGDDEEY